MKRLEKFIIQVKTKAGKGKNNGETGKHLAIETWAEGEKKNKKNANV